jgi:hypothetical protein
MEGVTVLYIPKEGFDMPIEVASKNKELVQRLESNKNLQISYLTRIHLKFNLNFSIGYSLVKTIKRSFELTGYLGS